MADTQLKPIIQTKFALADHDKAGGGGSHAEFTFGATRSAKFVFVNGRYSAQLSKLGKLPRGVRVSSLAQALETEPDRIEPHLARVADIDANPFVALNTGFLQDGAYIFLPKNNDDRGHDPPAVHLDALGHAGSFAPARSRDHRRHVEQRSSRATSDKRASISRMP